MFSDETTLTKHGIINNALKYKFPAECNSERICEKWSRFGKVTGKKAVYSFFNCVSNGHVLSTTL